MRAWLGLVGVVVAGLARADGSAQQTVLACSLDGHQSEGREQVDPAAAERLFGTLFFRHLRRREDCPASPSSDRPGTTGGGDIVPTIVSVLHGSFTAPKLKENLYVISLGECGTPDELGGYRIVITRDHDEKIALVSPYAASAAIRVLNVDGDGIDEFVAISTSCLNGVCTETASILRASGLKLSVVKDLGAVYYSTCCATKDTPGQVFCSNVVLRGGQYLKITDSKICTCL